MREKLEKTIEHFRGELAKIRAGKASVELLEDVEVNAYDAKMPLNQLASLSVPEPRIIIIQPWDKNIIKNIESALRTSLNDLNPVVDGNIIRISFPPPTEERRGELVKYVADLAEEARVAVRQIREEALKEAKAKEEDGEFSEDELHREKGEIQKFVDEYNKKIEEMRRKKEEEIIKV